MNCLKKISRARAVFAFSVLAVCLAGCQSRPAGEQAARPAESAQSPASLKSTGAAAENKNAVPAIQQGEEGTLLYHKPVKIKLKRDAKDNYTWELNGDDINEILSLDRQLRTKLVSGGEGSGNQAR